MKKLEIWKRMFKIGNPIEFLGLGDINFIKEMAVHLRDHNGIENFKRLVEMRLQLEFVFNGCYRSGTNTISLKQT